VSKIRTFVAGAATTVVVLLGLGGVAGAQTPDCDGPEAITNITYTLNGGTPSSDLAATLASAPGTGPLGQLVIDFDFTPGCEQQTITMAFHAAAQPFYMAGEVQPIRGEDTNQPGIGEPTTIRTAIPDGIPGQCFLQGDLVTGGALHPDVNQAEGRVYNEATFGIPGGVDRLIAKGYADDPVCLNPPPPTTAPAPTIPGPDPTIPAPTTTVPVDTRNCTELGRVNVPDGDVDYRDDLDSDHDGIACEADVPPPPTTITSATTPIPVVYVGSELPFTGPRQDAERTAAVAVPFLAAGVLLAAHFGLKARQQRLAAQEANVS